MSLTETIREHVREHRSGMLTDLLFALVWVTGVTVLFDVLNGPQWAYYLCLGAGVVAYYGFFASLEAAREQ
ncbi:hypothetical protein E6P09_17575 (plasmid) [Haloferax mediterranei ATCC 33500]|uniref:DUF8119 domain-containing protein n=1 Tax=Haloferax mediterranei (strain ATCC 33500 / DSM 1411 / JCM 8866 / NBRC 14739 / NCIMB 2177 / R-4) TaxID=523841 RepID=I3R9Q9_HALMT|nr:hypothetical protein [Haloferax mediterranei]AFK20969.2 hypothetical protein HFX_5135 [Haloferax mediterranei ATCC 33500]AHZ24167.1 hypothetical protein BM92_18355 [Haloferax mediterranei ATCC 33500]MDX5989952.1 hypothetical protein [Haloferax mediterranei ATCC 33500]QCQ77140.1 hypothetical protein E6P09_17575 [Haloferax mediterranei ATCC 33500]